MGFNYDYLITILKCSFELDYFHFMLLLHIIQREILIIKKKITFYSTVFDSFSYKFIYADIILW